MAEDRIRRAVHRLAEEGVPASVDLWPAIRNHLAARSGASADNTDEGTLSMTPTLMRPRRLRGFALAALALTLLVAVVAATPQGRALAQNVWQFFAPAASTTFDVPAGLSQPSNPAAPTAVPEVFVGAGCDAADHACNIAAAEALTGLDARLPAGGIAGLSLHHVSVSPDGSWLRLTYTAPQGGGLVISQARAGLPASPWEAVPEGAAEAVKVGGADGEYVEGTFVVTAGSDEAVWNPSAPVQRLRWRVGDVLYEIAKLGDTQAIEHLDKAALIAIAESLE